MRPNNDPGWLASERRLWWIESVKCQRWNNLDHSSNYIPGTTRTIEGWWFTNAGIVAWSVHLISSVKSIWLTNRKRLGIVCCRRGDRWLQIPELWCVLMHSLSHTYMHFQVIFSCVSFPVCLSVWLSSRPSGSVQLKLPLGCTITQCHRGHGKILIWRAGLRTNIPYANSDAMMKCHHCDELY